MMSQAPGEAFAVAALRHDPPGFNSRPAPVLPLVSPGRARALILEACAGHAPVSVHVLHDMSQRTYGVSDEQRREDYWLWDRHDLRRALGDACPGVPVEWLVYETDPAQVGTNLAFLHETPRTFEPQPGALLVLAGTRFKADSPALAFLERAVARDVCVLLLMTDGERDDTLPPGLRVLAWEEPDLRAEFPVVVPLPPGGFTRTPHEALMALLKAGAATDDARYDEAKARNRIIELEQANPCLARLLMAASLAVWITPGHLRSLRRAVIPWAPLEIENDLLNLSGDPAFSAIPAIITTTGLHTEIDEPFRTLFRQRLAADPDLLDQAHAVAARADEHTPACFNWERDVTWLLLSQDHRMPNRSERLAQALKVGAKALDDAPEPAKKIARWLKGAIVGRLLSAARDADRPALLELLAAASAAV